MAADLDGSVSEGARLNAHALTRVRVFDPKQFVRQIATELGVQPTEVCRTRWRFRWVLPRVDFAVEIDMSARLYLEGTPLGVFVVIVGKCAIDVSRMRVVPLDEIRVVAVDRPDQVANRHPHLSWKLACQPVCFGHKIEGAVL